MLRSPGNSHGHEWTQSFSPCSAGRRSLWRVDDEWTRLLMEDFYRRLWVVGETKSDALWKAKVGLRARGASLRDWAGWLLTGDTD